MQFDDEVAADAIRRLRRVEGQIGGIIKMIGDGRECRDVFQQVAAATKALERAGFRLLASQIRACVEDEGAAARDGYTPDELERLFLSMS